MSLIKPSFEQLPVELQELVLQRVNIKTLGSSCTMVSKAWKSIIETPQFWKRVMLEVHHMPEPFVNKLIPSLTWKACRDLALAVAKNGIDYSTPKHWTFSEHVSNPPSVYYDNVTEPIVNRSSHLFPNIPNIKKQRWSMMIKRFMSQQDRVRYL